MLNNTSYAVTMLVIFQNIYLGKQYLLASGGQDTDLHLWIVSVGLQKHGFSKFGEPLTVTVTLHHTLCGHKAPIMMLKFSPSGMLIATASGDKTIRLWDAVKLAPVGILEGHKRYATSCCFSDDGALLAAGGGDRSVHIWKVDEIISQPSNLSSSHARKLFNRFPNHSMRENKKLIDWSVDDVCEWLVEQGLAEYTHNFRVNVIDGRELISLEDKVLETKLGVDALGHRNKILRLVCNYTKDGSKSSLHGPDKVPSEFLCPITQEMMTDPVLCSDGFSYERVAVEAWLSSGKRTSPMTNEKLTHLMLTPNRTLRNLITRYKEENT